MQRFFLLSALLLGLPLTAGCDDAYVSEGPAVSALTPGTTADGRLPGADHGGRPFSTTLTGEAEVPGPGDPDGSGSALVTLNLGQQEVCYVLAVEDIAPATAAHIHIGPEGVAGPIVVPLDPPTDGSSSGCVSDVDRDLIRDLLRNPEGYYVNVHNADFPSGALRGQLSR